MNVSTELPHLNNKIYRIYCFGGNKRKSELQLHTHERLFYIYTWRIFNRIPMIRLSFFTDFLCKYDKRMSFLANTNGVLLAVMWYYSRQKIFCQWPVAQINVSIFITECVIRIFFVCVQILRHLLAKIDAKYTGKKQFNWNEYFWNGCDWFALVKNEFGSLWAETITKWNDLIHWINVASERAHASY